jgi:peroxiredoxin
MRHFKILIPMFIIIISFSFLPTAFAPTKLEGQKAPDFEIFTLDGESFALSDWLQGPDHKALILAFFATWCERCDKDLEFFQGLKEQYADQGVQVLCVFTGRLSQIKDTRTHLEGLKIKLPVLIDKKMDKKKAVTKRYRVAGYPSAYAIDREGFLRFRYLGCSEDVKREFERKLKNLLSAHDDEKRKPEGYALDTDPLIIFE